MKNNMISVIVPVYNIEQYVKKTIQSICEQSYQDLEIILIDDGSTDNSGEILDFLACLDCRVIVVHKCNNGVTAARLSGIRVSAGYWIGFVDGDDYIEPQMFEILLNNAWKHNADISHCGYQMVFPSRVDYYYNTKKMVVQDNYQGLVDLLRGDFVEPGLWNKLVKSDIVKSVVIQKRIDTSIKINEDLLMNFFFFKNSAQSVYQDICLYHYVLRKGSAATSEVSPNKLYDPVKVQQILLDEVGEDRNLRDIIYDRLVTLYISGASIRNTDNEAYIDEFIDLCKNELVKLQPEILNNRHGKSVRFKYRLCRFSPWLYRWFHKLYSKARGTDNKYEVR